jgi:hypothetical protein
LSDDLVERLRGADSTGLPELRSINDARLRAFWVLRLGQRAGVQMMTPGEIASVLRDGYGISLPRQKIEGVLSHERETVARRKRAGKRAYQLMQAGTDEVEGIASGVLLVEPERALTSLRATEALLGTLTGTLKVCDPYVDPRTLDLLAECRGVKTIMLLTANLYKSSKFKRDAKAFEKEHGTILQVRTTPPGVLHDRYLIDDNRMLLFGTSLNGLGFKQSFVVEVGEDVRASVVQTFDSYWNTASPP